MGFDYVEREKRRVAMQSMLREREKSVREDRKEPESDAGDERPKKASPRNGRRRRSGTQRGQASSQSESQSVPDARGSGSTRSVGDGDS